MCNEDVQSEPERIKLKIKHTEILSVFKKAPFHSR